VESSVRLLKLVSVVVHEAYEILKWIERGRPHKAKVSAWFSRNAFMLNTIFTGKRFQIELF
jgi:hypothetical protein